MTKLIRNFIAGAASMASVYPSERRVRMVTHHATSVHDAISGDLNRIGKDFRVVVKSTAVVEDGKK